MLLEKCSRSTRIAALSGFIIIGAIAVYNWMVHPHINYILAAQKYQTVTKDLAKKNINLSSNVTSLKEKLKKLQSEFDSLHSGLISNSEAKIFFDSIQTVAEQSSCSVLSLNFLTTDTPENIDQNVNMKQARLNVAGNYKNIVSLIEKLQGDTSKILLDSININSSPDSDKLECDMTITVYVLAKKEQSND